VYGVGGGEGDAAHVLEGVGCGCGAADVPVLAGWVGADDEEVWGAAELAVAGAGGEGDDVAGVEGEVVAGLFTPSATSWAAEGDADFAGGYAEDLVGGGVEVVEGVDAVAPLRGPAVGGEGLFHGGGGLFCGGVGEGVAVEEDGEVRVVGHPSVGLEEEVLGGGRGLGGGGEAGGEESGGELAAVDGGHDLGSMRMGWAYERLRDAPNPNLCIPLSGCASGT